MGANSNVKELKGSERNRERGLGGAFSITLVLDHNVVTRTEGCIFI